MDEQTIKRIQNLPGFTSDGRTTGRPRLLCGQFRQRTLQSARFKNFRHRAGSSGRFESPAGSGPAKSLTGATSKEQKPVIKTAPRDYLDDFDTDDIEEIKI